jgi:3-oxoacyl-[acyl-carrier protein] reductase
VACIDLSTERAEAVAHEVVDLGGSAFPITADARDSGDIRRALGEAADALGGLEVVVDIVGTAWWGTSAEESDEDFDEAITTNLTQVFYALKAAVPHLIADPGKGTAFVCLASISALQSSRYHAAYGAAKAGVMSLVRTFADEYIRYGLRVNAVAPGGGDYESPGTHGLEQGVAHRQKAQEIADGVLFLASKLANRVTGQLLVTDGGYVNSSVYRDWTEEMLPNKAPAQYQA